MSIVSFRHIDPRDRLHPANARLSVMHSFEVSFDTESDIDALFDFLADQRDIWLKAGLSHRGAVGTIPIIMGGQPFYQVETPRNDLAMLFKLTFGGS